MIHFDFEFMLVVLTVVSGIIWAIDSLFFARPRVAEAVARARAEAEAVAGSQGEGEDKVEISIDDLPIQEPIAVEYSRAFFPVLLAVLVLRAFIFEPFRIPSGSMMPSLLVGDFILVSKFSYGLRLPVTHTRITPGDEPQRGDVVVFRYPQDEAQDYIKRVIGLPGDRVSYYNRRLSINGKPLGIEQDRIYRGLGEVNGMSGASGCDRRGADCEVFIETTDDVSYTVMTNPGSTYSINGDVVVPEGHYFVMGDNRDHSNDSRIWGYVPEENLVGKAVMVWMHWDWRDGGSGLDLSRIGRRISQ